VSALDFLVEGEFGEGAYGPTILLRLRSPEAAIYLQSILDRLASGGPGASTRLEDDPHISLGAALWTLELRVVAEPQLRRLAKQQDGGFSWVGTSDEWQTTSLLIEGLTDHAGHQYLTSEVDDDALVEVSQGEAYG
jgi:hypothetical protein